MADQNRRYIDSRIKDHKKSILNNSRNTNIASHCVDLNHFIEANDFELLQNDVKG